MLSHYFNQAQVFLYVQLSNLASKCDKQFESTTVTSWVISVVLIWSAIYLLYGKAIDAFLRRMALPVLYRSRLTESLWNAGFCISCIPLCITKLLLHTSRVTDIFNILTANIFIAEQSISAHVLFSFVVICAFYIHNICLTFIQKGYVAEFFAKGLLLLFLYSCYSLRYIRIGLSAIVLITLCSLTVEFTRICYSLNRGKIVKLGFVWIFICLLFVIHFILWGGVFLYIFPQFYLLPAVNAKVSHENLLSLVVFCATLWSYFWMEIFCAPAMKLVYYYVWPDYSYGHRDWLDYALFPPRNDVIQHLKQIRSKARLEQAHTLQKGGKKLQNGTKGNRSSVALYQTVRCVMAIKKRIRQKRAAKALASLASTSEQLVIADCPNE